MSEEHLAVRRIKEGTVLDHVAPGTALRVLSALGVTGQAGDIVTIAMNVPSDKLGKKDIVKIENRFLRADETDKISLISPSATVNIIRNYKVLEKRNVDPPSTLEGVFRCPNPTCISNSSEPLSSVFSVTERNPPQLRCAYCTRVFRPEDML
jgi:aspartate carbamoyltransferase regulatory subunit